MIDPEKIKQIKHGLRFNINAAENHGARCTQLTADAETWRWLLRCVELVTMEKCESCHDTGYYGDMGPGGAQHNNEYQPCECDKKQIMLRRFISERLNQCAT